MGRSRGCVGAQSLQSHSRRPTGVGHSHSAKSPHAAQKRSLAPMAAGGSRRTLKPRPSGSLMSRESCSAISRAIASGFSMARAASPLLGSSRCQSERSISASGASKSAVP